MCSCGVGSPQVGKVAGSKMKKPAAHPRTNDAPAPPRKDEAGTLRK